MGKRLFRKAKSKSALLTKQLVAAGYHEPFGVKVPGGSSECQ